MEKDTLTRKLRLPAAVIVFMACLPFDARAIPLYDNGMPSGVGPDGVNGRIVADDFTLGSAATITDVRFWSGEQSGAFTGAVTWQIYDMTITTSPVFLGARPGNLLASGLATSVARSQQGIDNNGFDIFQNDLFIGAVSLSPGQYWLGLHNGPLSQTTFTSFMGWERSPFSGNNRSDSAPFGENDEDFGDKWHNINAASAFQLFSNQTTAVPEPSTVLLLATGAAGCLRCGRRRGR